MNLSLINTKVWLDGDPIFSLNYIENNTNVYTDVNFFRPDPRNKLKPKIRYDAQVYLQEQSTTDGIVYTVPRKIIVNGHTFIKVS